MKTVALLIWEEVPEKVRLFLLPQEVVDRHGFLLDKCHGHYLNHVDNAEHTTEDLLLINWAIEEEGIFNQIRAGEDGVSERELMLASQWVEYEYEELPNLPDNTIITKVYKMGFLL